MRGGLKRPTAEALAVGALLCLGLTVRLWAINQARFDRDEAQSWAVARDIAQGRAWPTLGPGVSDSDAATPGPLFFYVMALPQLFTANPLAGSLFTTLLNLGGIMLAYAAWQRVADSTTAGLFLAWTVASPWTVVYGDRIWSANLLLPLGALVFDGLTRVLRRPQSPAIAVVMAALIVGFQIHLSTLSLWMMALAAIAVARPRLNRRWLLTGCLAGILLYVPYLVGEVRSGFANSRFLLAGASGTISRGSALVGLLAQFLALGTTDEGFFIADGFRQGFDPIAFWRETGLGRTIAFAGRASSLVVAMAAISWACVAAGLWRGVRHAWRRKDVPARERPLMLLFVGAVVGVVGLVLTTGRSGFAHYVIVLLPIAVAPAITFMRVLWNRPVGRWIARAIAVLMPITGLLLLRSYYRIDSRQSIPQQEAIVRFVLDRSQGRTFELRFARAPAQGLSYALLARRYFGASWAVTDVAHDVFTVEDPEATTHAPASGRLAGTLVLRTVSVRHEKR